MPSPRGPLVGVALLLGVAFGAPARAADDAKAVEFFEAKIRPVLVEHCQRCHSEPAAKANKLRGGLRLDTRAGWEAGGDAGPAVVPGKPGEGTLVKSLRHDGDVQMPPAGKLPDAVIADFEKWVRDGAVDPRTDKPAAKAAGIDLDKGREFWSLRPPKPQAVPAGDAVNPIDAFVRAKWAEKGLTPAAVADRRTLARRAAFGLTGLPPTPEQVEAFAADPSPEAWARYVDSLLASPAHGERWARHWLDVARYAEDQAHTFEVTPKTNAYVYRDWVVRAFNADMPYDRFARLQIAGDLVPESEGDPFTRLAGLGLMGLGAEYYKNTAREQAIAEELDDRVDTLTRGFLGFTVACARCHDHKFDPIPTRDYYAIAGVYNGAAMTTAPLVSAAEVKAYDAAQEKVKAAQREVDALLAVVGRAAAKDAATHTADYLVAAREPGAKSAKGTPAERYFAARWRKFLDPANAAKAPAAFKAWFALKPDADEDAVREAAEEVEATLLKLELPEPTAGRGKGAKGAKIDPLAKVIFLDQAAPLFVAAADAEKLFLAAADKPKLADLRGEVERQKAASPPAPPTAHVVSGAGQAMRVYVRGNPATKGDEAPKGFLRVLAPAGAAPAKDFTRLDLANAIASPGNPLTARVIVNRVWGWHFGRGLVATPSNFGALGERPSHPELLDYLAVEFVKNGWSLKWLHRQILASETYRLASDGGDSARLDPANVYLARGTRHRLDVEAWRDALLSVSGNLDPALGGPPFDLRDAGARRRTLYAKVSRHELDGLLRMFDFPDANATADRRNVTTVPQQQLFALNSDFMVNQAKAFAARAGKLAATDAGRVEAAYRLAFNRAPEPREAELAAKFLALPANPDDKLTRWQQYAQALLASNEFLYAD